MGGMAKRPSEKPVYRLSDGLFVTHRSGEDFADDFAGFGGEICYGGDALELGLHQFLPLRFEAAAEVEGAGEAGGFQIGEFSVKNYASQQTTGEELATAAALRELGLSGMAFTGVC